ncbi:hypothetical protein PJF56_07240 [Roseofilum sp. BLCC_M91]|uniref:Uncharacterized protein n=1 Tax=Roseofilum halophilum BLCC-M91 TaxID=3022259 RepID=A0ABT7BHI8_9CYAN|nr:hypothetical protein [Roseofilum halophilum]MDJ1178652.1 hypothetical protein [Roseofilum halophilum BLCC-M91]
MNQNPQDPHTHAEQEFQHSLHQLGETLKTGKIPQSSTQKSDPLRTHQFQEPEPMDEATLEEAAADIEEFMNQLSEDE